MPHATEALSLQVLASLCASKCVGISLSLSCTSPAVSTQGLSWQDAHLVFSGCGQSIPTFVLLSPPLLTTALSVCLHSPSFQICLDHQICMMLLRHLLTNTCNFCFSFLVILQGSAPYKSMAFTFDQKTLNLGELLLTFHLHI